LTYALHHGDCLEVMAGLPDASVDMILCDLPYGTTACKWDTVIPFEPLWAQYRRVAKRNAAIVLTAAQPFTSALVMSNPEWFKYELIIDKLQTGAPGVAKHRPLPIHESALVFASGKTTYNPIMGVGDPYDVTTKNGGGRHGFGFTGKQYRCTNAGTRYPVSILCSYKVRRGVHETQKPIGLMEYLIRTYTQEGETVLDNCMGSGTTGVACANTGRQFIGIERDDKYFAIASERIAAAHEAKAA